MLAAKVRTLGIDGSRIHQRFLELAYVKDDKIAIAREIQWFAGKPEDYLSFGLQAANLNLHGERRESMSNISGPRRQRDGRIRYVADDIEEADARADALAGNCQSSRRFGTSGIGGGDVWQTSMAENLAAETSKLSPTQRSGMPYSCPKYKR